MLLNADGLEGFVQIRTQEEDGVVRVGSYSALFTTSPGPAKFSPDDARELALKILRAAGHSQAEILAVRVLLASIHESDSAST